LPIETLTPIDLTSPGAKATLKTIPPPVVMAEDDPVTPVYATVTRCSTPSEARCVMVTVS